jgi:hypothetical protein
MAGSLGTVSKELIEHQVHPNAFTQLQEYGQSECLFSCLELSKYIYGCCDVGTSYLGLPILAFKSSNNIFMRYLWHLSKHTIPIPRRSCPSHHQFYPLWGMNAQNNDMTPATS